MNASAEHQAKQLLLDTAVIRGIAKRCESRLPNFKPIKDTLKMRGKMLRAAGVNDLSRFSVDDTKVDTYISWACADGKNIHKFLPSYEEIHERFSSTQASNNYAVDEFDVVGESKQGANEDFTIEEASSWDQSYSGLAISFLLGFLLGAVVHYFHTASTIHLKRNSNTIRRPEL